MKVKIDTKEIFHVIRLNESELSAIMTEELRPRLLTFLQSETKNVVLNLQDIETIQDAAAETLVNIQQKFYEQNASFVICGLRPQVELALDSSGLLEIMNVTPTESEAWDIVQMEEIERELLSDDGTGQPD